MSVHHFDPHNVFDTDVKDAFVSGLYKVEAVSDGIYRVWLYANQQSTMEGVVEYPVVAKLVMSAESLAIVTALLYDVCVAIANAQAQAQQPVPAADQQTAQDARNYGDNTGEPTPSGEQDTAPLDEAGLWASSTTTRH